MSEQELKDIWNNSSQTANISIESNKLIEELNTKVVGIKKKIRIRDIREITASVIGIIIFSYLLFEIPFPITKLACGLAITWFVLVIYKFRKSKIQSTTSKLSLSLKEQLAYEEATMQQQENLLDSAIYWYSIPPFIMNFLFILGLGNPSDFNWTNNIGEIFLPLTVNFKIVILVGLALFYAFTIWINKRAISRDVKPLLKNIRATQQQLNKE